MFAPRLVMAFACAALAAPSAAAYPERPIRLIIPFSAGATSDILARIIMQPLEGVLGQSIVIDNRPGAGGTLGAAMAARATADGHTLAWGTVSNHAISPALYARPGYDPIRDFAPVALLLQVPHVIMVQPTGPAKSLLELIEIAKASPGKLNYASSGNGTISHLIGELFKQRAGIDLKHVPYKSSAQGLPDFLGGRIDVMFDTIVVSAAPIRSGQALALAVTSGARAPSLAQVPTVAEAGVAGFEAGGWFGVYAPAGTDPAIVRRLNAALLEVLRRPDTVKRLEAQGASIVGSTPEAFVAHMSVEVPKWAGLVKSSGARVD